MENFEEKRAEKKREKKKQSGMPASAIVAGIIVAFLCLKVVSGEATVYDNNGNIVSGNYEE